MQTYNDKLREVGIEALEDNKEDIKKAIAETQIEVIRKAPQYLEKIMEMLPELFLGDETGSS